MYAYYEILWCKRSFCCTALYNYLGRLRFNGWHYVPCPFIEMLYALYNYSFHKPWALQNPSSGSSYWQVV